MTHDAIMGLSALVGIWAGVATGYVICYLIGTR